MTKQEAFKIGFLMKCAEDGLTPSQVERRILKSSALVKKADPPGILGQLRNKLTGTLWTLGLLGPPAIGAGIGYSMSKAKDDMYSIEESKKREELAEYYRAIDHLKRSARQRKVEF